MSRSRSRLINVVLLALALSYGGYNFGRALFGPKQSLDFAQHYVASRFVLDGESGSMYLTGEAYQQRAAAYGVRPVLDDMVMRNAYPPPAALLFVPFALVSFNVARFAFLAVSVGAALLVIPLIFADRPGQRRRDLVIAGCALTFIFFPSHLTWYMGQSNFLILLCLVLALRFIRQNRIWLAGLSVALVSLLKIFPLLLLIFFGLKRQYRLIAATIAWFAVLVVCSFLVFEPTLYGSFLSDVLPREAWSGGHHRDQAIAGFFTRLLMENQVVDPLMHRPELARGLGSVVRLLVLAVAVLSTRKRTHAHTVRYEIEYGLWFVAILLILPKAWDHYAVLLLLPYLLLLELVVFQRFNKLGVLFVLTLSFCIWSFILTTGVEYRMLPKHVVMQPLYSSKLFATMLLFGCCLWVLRDRGQPALESGSCRWPVAC